jgi:aquaporin related protein
MAQEQPGSLPVYYGERMPDGTVIESPQARPKVSSDSRDALLRLPIQPGEAHVHPGLASPSSPMSPPDAPGASAGHPVRRRGSTVPDSSRWLTYPPEEQDDEFPPPRRSNRYGPSEYRGMSRRTPYVEDYSDGEDYPRHTRRSNRRHTRPPPAHGRASGAVGRYSHDQGRASFDSRVDYGYESDTPRKARFVQRYSDEEGYDEELKRSRPYAGGGGGGGRKPPRAPSTEEVMRLPWTMWMNSSAKNREFPGLFTILEADYLFHLHPFLHPISFQTLPPVSPRPHSY